MKCTNCYGGLDYHSDDLCYSCYHADSKEYKRRQLLRAYNGATARAQRVKAPAKRVKQ